MPDYQASSAVPPPLRRAPICATDLAPPVPAPIPRTILFQRKRANRRIMNEDRFVDMLRGFGEVREAPEWRMSRNDPRLSSLSLEPRHNSCIFGRGTRFDR